MKSHRAQLLNPDEVDFRSCVENGSIPLRASSLNVNQRIGYYLMASYLYYHKDESLFSDDEYDRLCHLIYDDWDGVAHPHKHLVEREALRSTTGFYIKNYPLLVMHAADRLYRKRNEINNVRHKKLSFF